MLQRQSELQMGVASVQIVCLLSVQTGLTKLVKTAKSIPAHLDFLLVPNLNLDLSFLHPSDVASVKLNDNGKD